MSHIGRPRDKKTGITSLTEKTYVNPVVDYLKNQLSIKITTPDIELPSEEALENPDFSSYLNQLDTGKIDALYLPNTRWFKGEESKDSAREELGKYFGSIADIYVNDAFGSWQPHASTIEPTRYLPSYAGLLMQKEIDNLSKVLAPKRPLVAVVAGSKFDTKIGPLTALLEVADYLVLGGVIYNAYLCAKYGCSINGIDATELESARRFLKAVEKHPDKLIELPVIVESQLLDERNESKINEQFTDQLSETTKLEFILDASAKSFQTEKIKNIFSEAKTIFVNAVMGFTPNFSEGTIALDETIHGNQTAQKLFGGGDTLQEFKALLPAIYNQALADEKYYFFTGGGTILKAIQEGSAYGLAPVKALLESRK